MYSRMMQSSPSTCSKSKMRPMFSWSSTAYRRASSTKRRRWLGLVGVAELLDDDRALEAGLADEQALVDRAHAAGAQLVEHLVLRFGHVGHSERTAARGWQSPPGGQGTAATLYSRRTCAYLGSRRGRRADRRGRSPTRPRPSPRGLTTLRARGAAQGRAGGGGARARARGRARSWWACRAGSTARSGPQAEKVLGLRGGRCGRSVRVPVVTRDERLTSVVAEQALIEAGVSRPGRARRWWTRWRRS